MKHLASLPGSGLAGRVGFAIGTGRCGTYFIHRALAMEPSVSSVHERNVLNEAFHRYCKWYGLRVDHAGFLRTKHNEILEDLGRYSFSFESSAHLSLSILELFQELEAKFLLLIRSPEKVVNSYLHKGWYCEDYVRADPNLALGYQDTPSFHHFLGRIVPFGERYEQWRTLTRVGKLAWYWSALNEAVLSQFDQMPPSHWKVVKLEELDHPCYQQVVEFFGLETALERSRYDLLARSRPNKREGKPTIIDWSDQEVTEFEQEVASTAMKLGYESRVSELSKHTVSQTGPSWPRSPIISRIGRRLLKVWLSLRTMK